MLPYKPTCNYYKLLLIEKFYLLRHTHTHTVLALCRWKPHLLQLLCPRSPARPSDQNWCPVGSELLPRMSAFVLSWSISSDVCIYSFINTRCRLKSLIDPPSCWFSGCPYMILFSFVSKHSHNKYGLKKKKQNNLTLVKIERVKWHIWSSMHNLTNLKF